MVSHLESPCSHCRLFGQVPQSPRISGSCVLALSQIKCKTGASISYCFLDTSKGADL